MVNFDLNYIVHDAKVQLYFYIASDILKNVEKNPQPEPAPELRIHSSKCELVSCAYPASKAGLIGVGLQLGAFGIGIHNLIHEIITQEIEIQGVAFV